MRLALELTSLRTRTKVTHVTNSRWVVLLDLVIARAV